MNDRELETRLRAWYADGDRASEAAPADLRESLPAIPLVTPMPRREPSRRRGFTLFAVAAVLVVGGAVAAAGSGLLRLTSVVPPTPSEALLASPGPSPSQTPTETPSMTPAPTPNLRPGDRIAFMRNVDKKRSTCPEPTSSCPTRRVWVVDADGQGAHELFPDGVDNQTVMGWSPDGTRLLYADGLAIYLTDASGGQPQAVDTGCPPQAGPTASTCQWDSQAVFSPDGRHIAFVRELLDDATFGVTSIATMDLESGRIAVLDSTKPMGGWRPDWSPDGTRIVFSRWGEEGSDQPLAAVFTIDANGEDIHQLNPATIAAQDAAWSPDGSRIVFVSANTPGPDDGSTSAVGDLYTIRPDGTDLRQLTTDRSSTAPAWTADGGNLFTRVGGGSGDPGWWTMDADGGRAALFVAASTLGVTPTAIAVTRPAWQPTGGAAIVPPPWTPAPAIAVGPPPPGPAPTATPTLAPGFAWTGAPTSDVTKQLGATATVLGDGRVLVTANCGTAAELYDPASGTFSPTGSTTVPRAFAVATPLQDGRVLLTGGYNCAAAGSDGIWASAELYDPATGTFGPTGSMKAAREFHTATLLADGRVLIAGGLSGPPAAATGGIVLASTPTADDSTSVLSTAEVYDPATGRFSKTGSMSTFRDNHTATLLGDGRVLVTGGGGEAYASSTSADIYDPTTGKFSKTGSMKTGRWLHSATLLHDGRVLILGGRSPKDSVYDSAETFDPRSGRFAAAGSMGEGRQQHTATLLPDGRVLIAGGYWSDGKDGHMLSSTEMYDPAIGGFSAIGSMGAPRDGHQAARLQDGRVLLVGGEDTRAGDWRAYWTASAVLYQP